MPSFNITKFLTVARQAGTDTENVEVKTAVGGLPRTIAETISAFANAHGGIIICGLCEKEGFTAAEGFDAKRIASALAQACADSVEPPVRASVDIEEVEGALVVIAHIPETEAHLKPCYVKARPMYEGSFYRSGDGDRKLTRYEINRLLEERQQPRNDTEIVAEASTHSFDSELVQRFLARERKNAPRVFVTLTDEEALLTLGVTARDSEGTIHPTLAGLMALGTHPQQYYPRCNITFAVFPGLTKADLSEHGARFLDSQTIIGSIPVMLAETLAAVRRNMRTSSHISGGRSDITEYPTIAIREAVANALMHRDYSPEGRGAPVQVNMFPDRLEVLSPGGLYGAVTLESLGTYGVSASRNESLSRILESAAFPEGYPESGFVVENKGTGYAQIQASMRQHKLPDPQPVDSPSMFALTLYNHQFTATPRPRSHQQSDSAHERVIAAFHEQTTLSTQDVAELLGVAHSTAYRLLARLIDHGDVRLVAGTRGKSARYELVP